MANSVDPNQEQPDLGQHSLHMPFCQKFCCLKSLGHLPYSKRNELDLSGIRSFWEQILAFQIRPLTDRPLCAGIQTASHKNLSLVKNGKKSSIHLNP